MTIARLELAAGRSDFILWPFSSSPRLPRALCLIRFLLLISVVMYESTLPSLEIFTVFLEFTRSFLLLSHLLSWTLQTTHLVTLLETLILELLLWGYHLLAPYHLIWLLIVCPVLRARRVFKCAVYISAPRISLNKPAFSLYVSLKSTTAPSTTALATPAIGVLLKLVTVLRLLACAHHLWRLLTPLWLLPKRIRLLLKATWLHFRYNC